MQQRHEKQGPERQNLKRCRRISFQGRAQTATSIVERFFRNVLASLTLNNC